MPYSSVPTTTPPPSLFPTYLLPSLPFRRRQSSADSTDSAASAATAGSPPNRDSYLSGHASHIRCARCLSDLALSSQIISKGFTGRHGRAYLVSPSTSAISAARPFTAAATTITPNAYNDAALPNLPNTYTHNPVPRQLVTGAHTVGDISCAHCGSVLGWKYVAAENEEQKYKVGKFILETRRICRSNTWESEAMVDGEGSMLTERRRDTAAALLPPNELKLEDQVEFDSQDEDECDALFAGSWTPQLAKKYRREKAKGFATSGA